VLGSAVLSGSLCATRDFIPLPPAVLSFLLDFDFSRAHALSLSLLDRLTILLPTKSYASGPGRRYLEANATNTKHARARYRASTHVRSQRVTALRGQCRLAPFFVRYRYPVGNYSSPPTRLSSFRYPPRRRRQRRRNVMIRYRFICRLDYFRRYSVARVSRANSPQCTEYTRHLGFME